MCAALPAGDFQFVADMETPRLAMEDNDQGVWTGMGGGVSQSGGGSAYVTSLSRGSGFRIYVGGNFDAVNGTAASNVAYFVNSPDGMVGSFSLDSLSLLSCLLTGMAQVCHPSQMKRWVVMLYFLGSPWW